MGSEMMDDRVYSELELRKLLPVSVISELPVIAEPTSEVAERKRIWFGWAMATVILAAILAGSAVSYFRG